MHDLANFFETIIGLMAIIAIVVIVAIILVIKKVSKKDTEDTTDTPAPVDNQLVTNEVKDASPATSMNRELP